MFRAAVGGFAALCASFALADTPESSPLYLADSTFDGSLTRIYSVDPDSGGMTLRADLGTAWTPVLGVAAADARVLYLTASDNSASDRCSGARSCLLVRIVLDPLGTVPISTEEIGVVRTDSGPVTEIVGLTFGTDGRLWASSQGTDALYAVDPETATAVEIGPFGIDLDGGDLTYDGDGRLLLWNSLGDQAGLYDVDPLTGAATVFELHPGLSFAGLASLGHTNRLLGASPPDDRLYEIDSVEGLKRAGPTLALGGAPFDHKRGDLDSPFCASDASCEDGDACTANRCTPGGCRAETSDADADSVGDCADLCPDTGALEPVNGDGCSVEQLCPCDGDWPNRGAYVSCVSAAVEQTGEDGKRVSASARSRCGRAERAPRRSAFSGSASGT